ncbi:MAG: DUF364 domain-containing protein [Brevibacterium sp.]|nr:DUF364 domain-containing protein [Brevibacterium sp.]
MEEVRVGDPWKIYDELIEGVSPEPTVAAASVGLRWSRILSSEGGLGMGLTFGEQSRPPLFEAPSFVGAPLREVAALVKSWNFAEAALGLAALNAWYSQPETAAKNGFVSSDVNLWQQVFHPYSEAVAGKKVSVIGHFPFAPEPLAQAAELRMLERNTKPGDYPDPAAEYLLPDSDFVFISSSAFVNKTMPRLLELSHNATTVLVGPSTPLSPTLFKHGADVLTGFVAKDPEQLFDAVGNVTLSGMYDHGQRVQQQA